MSKKTIWVNTIVHNEENFIWFAIMGVVDLVDKVLVWDTGSTDKTVEIIKEIIKQKGEKVEFKEVGLVDKNEFTKMRQKMLEESNCDWILILDGDEIWWKESIKQVIELINKESNIDVVVVPFYNAVGDIYHYQGKSAGKYEIKEMKGHLTIRAINRHIPGLHLANPYGQEGYVDDSENMVQNRNPERIKFINSPFLHLTHLKRSSKDNHNKFKLDYGFKFDKNFHFPEALYLDKPDIIQSPWRKRSWIYESLGKIKSLLKH